MARTKNTCRQSNMPGYSRATFPQGSRERDWVRCFRCHNDYRAHHLSRHLRERHGVGKVRTVTCGLYGCTYATERPTDMARHRRSRGCPTASRRTPDAHKSSRQPLSEPIEPAEEVKPESSVTHLKNDKISQPAEIAPQVETLIPVNTATVTPTMQSYAATQPVSTPFPVEIQAGQLPLLFPPWMANPIPPNMPVTSITPVDTKKRREG